MVTQDADGNWEWKPQATATEICRFDRHWGNVGKWGNGAFAFYLPTEDHLLAVNDIEDHCFREELN